MTKEEYIAAERRAGFYSKFGPNHPASSSFSCAGPSLKNIMGEIRTATPHEPTELIEEEVPHTLFVIRWMSHEYEQGWGVTDREEFCTLYKSLQDAKASVALRFNESRSLYGAGDYFEYPSGPNDQYHIYEVSVLAGHRIFNILESKGINVPGISADPKVQRFREQLMSRLQNANAVIHTIDFEGLSPKPITEAPHHLFPSSQPPKWFNTVLHLA